MTLPRALVLLLVRRAVVMWLIARLALGVLAIVWLSPLGAVAFAVLVAALCWLDIKARGEAILYGNLGISPQWVVLPALGVTLLLEVVVGGMLALLASGPPPDPLL